MKIKEREQLVNTNLKLIFNSKKQSLHSSKFKHINGTFLKDPSILIAFLVDDDLIENESIENDNIYFLTEKGYLYTENSNYWTDNEATVNGLSNLSIIHANNNYRSIGHHNSKVKTNKTTWKQKLTRIGLQLIYTCILGFILLYAVQQSIDRSVPILEMDLIELIKML